VSDAFGHSLQFSYFINASGSRLLQSITDPAGKSIVYSYDSQDHLTQVQYPDANTRKYKYTGYNSTLLTQLTDEAGVAFATWSYSADGSQVVASSNAGNVNAFSYSSLGPSVTVTDPLGTTRNYGQRLISGVYHNTSADQFCPGCAEDMTRTLDENGNVTSRTDFLGTRTQSEYDLTRNLEISRTEAYGTQRARTITTHWDGIWRQPDLITEPNRRTAFTYDSLGNVLTKTLTDTSIMPNVSRSWTYTYDSYGRVLTAKGPRTDVNDTTTYAYYTCTTGYECGQVQTVTDAIGNVTTYSSYNAHGQPLTISDPNGVLTTLTYDLRQRLTSRVTAGETTAFAYYPTGLLQKVTLPDGSFIQYTYDGAHRLTQIADGSGDKVVYTLDAMGNHTAENAYDPSGALHRTHTRVINTLNQVYQEVNAAGTAAVTTTFTYDNNGNQTSISAPLSRTTGNQYDELNRLTQITDPLQGLTKFGYDANDNLTSVIDPRNLATTYHYDGFGDLVTQVSPDTGTTSNTYDSAGNIASATDARGAVASYTYDALNRVTQVEYSIGGTADQTISFTYDTGTNGKGRLTSASDAQHAMTWSYDALGRVTGKTQTVGAVTKTTGYAYTNGNLTTLTTPSGQTIAYGYNSNHQITSVAVNGATVLSGVTYEPFGPVNGWTWGNGTTTTRAYDTDGKITQIASAGTKGYSYDDAFRITGITDTSSGSSSWTYGYDALDRLTSGTNGTVTRGWTYDANGNRLTETGSSPSTYSIASGSNQITSITGALARTYLYDAVGNTVSYSTVNATYNARGRLQTLANGSDAATYVYNALGQMVESSGTSDPKLYAYDEAAHLIGEYDGSGNLIEETVWLGDIPVATLRPNGSGVDTYYVHTDHLNTPRQVTRPADNAQVWTWFSDPFGTDAANSNPAGVGGFAYNLRFPGQIFKGPAGLHYNANRWYDPAAGGYTQSDPAGLVAGVNTYAYVGRNPISDVDPQGLSANIIQQLFPSPWTSSSGQACSDDKQHCEELLRIDTDTCNAITKRRGRAAGEACHASASERYAACYRGRPLPPLNTWNNRESAPIPTPVPPTVPVLPITPAPVPITPVVPPVVEPVMPPILEPIFIP
jgi:RHS repeat-associated protein